MGELDIGAFLQTGGRNLLGILSEEQKHKRKMQGLIDEEKRKQEERERDRIDTRKEFGMGIIEKVIAGDFNPHTKQQFVQWGVKQKWFDPGILGPTTPFPVAPKAKFGTSEYWQQKTGGELYSGGWKPPPPIGMFEPSAVESKPSTVSGDKRLFAPTPPAPKTPTPIAPEKIREQAYRLTTSVMRGPQFQELLSGLDPKARIKFEKDFAQMLERTYKFLQAGQFPEMRRTEEEWDEIYGE